MKNRILLVSTLFALLSILPHPTLAAGPSISAVSPATASAGTPVTFSATVSSGAGIQYCHLYVDLADVGEMTVSGSSASKSYTFESGGSRIAFVFCKDNSGGMASGPNTAIWVTGSTVNTPPLSGSQSEQDSSSQEQTQPQTPSSTAPGTTAARTLLKLACAEGAQADDPCKAVYYIGADGKRHAYSNGKVFFTWYANFDSVQTVTQSELAAYPLGKNVTYRPGVRMVKFQTLDKVYAVGKDGLLRWVASESVARELYGADWNTKIDDIPDTFYGDYTFGADITASANYNVTQETSAVPTFD